MGGKVRLDVDPEVRTSALSSLCGLSHSQWSGSLKGLTHAYDNALAETVIGLFTANQPFGEWNRIFPNPAMTLAAVDRLVHHATIVELNVESYRRRTAVERRKGPGRPPTRATIKDIGD
jgi:hypothetical protein